MRRKIIDDAGKKVQCIYVSIVKTMLTFHFCSQHQSEFSSCLAAPAQKPESAAPVYTEVSSALLPALLIYLETNKKNINMLKSSIAQHFREKTKK